MKILITGSHGFVGRRFTKRFLDEGHVVHGVDNLSSGLEPQQWAFKPINLAHAHYDYSDLRSWMKEFSATDYDLILHLAAVVGGRLKIENDQLAVAADLAIDSDFFRWVAQPNRRPCKVVYFSSSAVYPTMLQTESMHVSLAEDLINFNASRIGVPDMTYGWSKLSGEYLAKIAAEKYGLDVVIYRPFSGYGEDQDLTYPFPSIVKRVHDGEDPVTVWGSGKQARDFLYIEDIVDAVLATMDKLKPGEALNLGSGIGTTFRTIAHMAAAHLGKDLQVVNDTTKPEGVFWRVADTSKLDQWYKPTTSLNDGIIKALEWLDRNKKAL